MANQLVQARVDKVVKEEAAAVLAAMGLTVSDAVRLLLTWVARGESAAVRPPRSQCCDRCCDEGGASRQP